MSIRMFPIWEHSILGRPSFFQNKARGLDNFAADRLKGMGSQMGHSHDGVLLEELLAEILEAREEHPALLVDHTHVSALHETFETSLHEDRKEIWLGIRVLLSHIGLEAFIHALPAHVGRVRHYDLVARLEVFKDTEGGIELLQFRRPEEIIETVGIDAHLDFMDLS